MPSPRKSAQPGKPHGHKREGNDHAWDGNVYGKPVLGWGASGIVYAIDEKRVVKMPADGQTSQVFEREREVYRIFKRNNGHENVLSCYDTKNHTGLILQRCRGSVQDRCQRGRSERPSLDQILSWVYQAARGLAFVHRCGVVQADVGCHNMLLDAHDNLQIADFSGSGITIPGSEKPALITNHAYKQNTLSGQPTILSDLFAFGAAIFEMLTGYPPPGDFRNEVASGFTKKSFPQLQMLRDDSEKSTLEGIIRGCWRREFYSADEIAELLEMQYPHLRHRFTRPLDSGVARQSRGKSDKTDKQQKQQHQTSRSSHSRAHGPHQSTHWQKKNNEKDSNYRHISTTHSQMKPISFAGRLMAMVKG